MIECDIMGIKKTGIKILEFDFTNFLSEGDTISGLPIISENSSGAIVTVGIPTVINLVKVTVLVTGVEFGEAIVTCTINTSFGAKEPTEQKINIS